MLPQNVNCIHALQQLVNVLASSLSRKVDSLVELVRMAGCVKCWNAIFDFLQIRVFLQIVYCQFSTQPKDFRSP